jgi:hypothetical protein
MNSLANQLVVIYKVDHIATDDMAIVYPFLKSKYTRRAGHGAATQMGELMVKLLA